MMHAKIGSRILIRGRAVGAVDRHGDVLEVRGADGAPPYLVRFDGGHEALVYPGPDCVIDEVGTTPSNAPVWDSQPAFGEVPNEQ
jgi:hypothetical protein